jgi:hypothetical protein
LKKKIAVNWEKLSNDQLLQVRIMDLNLQISGSAVETATQRLYQELEARGICFRPPCYLADEWLCPDREPIIGIPFCLAHPRLKTIEIEMMYEAEGGNQTDCMKLLRHECGHAINYAYKLYTRTRYSDSYRYQPYSRRFVVHLDDHYAQAHPDEDFAETFAVWLSPENQWQQKYAKWPALQKLVYVDSLMKKIGPQPPTVTARSSPPWAARRMRSTLASYYERKRNQLGWEFKGYYDDSLKKVFSTEPKNEKDVRAAKILRKYKRSIVEHLAKWTGHRKFDLHKLINRITVRCESLDLYAADDLREIIGVTTFLATIACGTGRKISQGKI